MSSKDCDKQSYLWLSLKLSKMLNGTMVTYIYLPGYTENIAILFRAAGFSYWETPELRLPEWTQDSCLPSAPLKKIKHAWEATSKKKKERNSIVTLSHRLVPVDVGVTMNSFVSGSHKWPLFATSNKAEWSVTGLCCYWGFSSYLHCPPWQIPRDA